MSAASSSSDLMSLGEHCSVSHCGQIDFLPFTCDCCTNVFCLTHRTYAAHQCPKAAGRQTEIIVCPVCAKAIRLTAGQDANAAFHEHSQSDRCDPANYQRVHKKPRCPVSGCKEKLNAVSTYHCKACSRNVCMKHRDTADHGCKEARAAQAAQVARKHTQPSSTTTSHPVLGRPFSAKPAAPARPAAASSAASSAAQHMALDNSVKGSAFRRQQMISGQAGAQQAPPTVNPLASATAAGTAPSASQQWMREVCPMCNARFATVERLVQHTEEYHPTTAYLHQDDGRGGTTGQTGRVAAGQVSGTEGGTSGAGQQRAGDTFRCPSCACDFRDAVELLLHSERCSGRRPGTTAARQCVMS